MCSPLVGGQRVEHLKQNVQALDISLSPEQIQRIENAKPIELGFPYNIIVRTPIMAYSSLLQTLRLNRPEFVNTGIVQRLRKDKA